MLDPKIKLFVGARVIYLGILHSVLHIIGNITLRQSVTLMIFPGPSTQLGVTFVNTDDPELELGPYSPLELVVLFE